MSVLTLSAALNFHVVQHWRINWDKVSVIAWKKTQAWKEFQSFPVPFPFEAADGRDSQVRRPLIQTTSFQGCLSTRNLLSTVSACLYQVDAVYAYSTVHTIHLWFSLKIRTQNDHRADRQFSNEWKYWISSTSRTDMMKSCGRDWSSPWHVILPTFMVE